MILENYHLELTGACLDCLHVVVGDIVLDPGPVRASVSLGFRVCMEMFCDSAVAQQTGRKSHLQGYIV